MPFDKHPSLAPTRRGPDAAMDAEVTIAEGINDRLGPLSSGAEHCRIPTPGALPHEECHLHQNCATHSTPADGPRHTVKQATPWGDQSSSCISIYPQPRGWDRVRGVDCERNMPRIFAVSREIRFTKTQNAAWAVNVCVEADTADIRAGGGAPELQ
jgi:hypothetical protein